MDSRNTVAGLGACFGRCGIAAVSLGLASGQASATWSILLADTRTGEIAVGSATCVQGINLRGETPVLVLGRGAATAQSRVDVSGENRARVFSGLARGLTLGEVIGELASEDGDHQQRQYGMIDVSGGALTFSGASNAAWAGGVTGRIEAGVPGPAEDIVYAVQGNILTGEAVVLAAEEAILLTAGDLAERLMAGMEAAAALGGDGRCSCPGPDPTGCGAPPAEFVRTADVGYMLVGRVGDREQAGSFVPVDSSVGRVITGDLDGDGLGDLVRFSSFFGPVVMERNVTEAVGVPLVFEPTGIAPAASAPGFAGIGDVDGDGDSDLVYVDSSSINVLLSNGDGTFAPVVASALVNGLDDAALGAYDASSPGLELVVMESGNLRTYAFDASGAAAVVSTQLGAIVKPDAFAPTPDGVVMSSRFVGMFPFRAVGDGSFEQGGVIEDFTTSDSFLASGDVNGDGQPDYVFSGTAGAIEVRLDDGVGGYTPLQLLSAGVSGPRRDLALADTDGDGVAEIVDFGFNGQVVIHDGDAGGVFSASPVRRLVGDDAFAAGDLTGDGLADLVSAGARVLAVHASGPGGLPDDDRGFAGGDYYLELNVPFGPSDGFEDPVEELREDFDAWRAGLVGVPDGTISTLSVNERNAWYTHGSYMTDTDPVLLLTPRDYAGSRVLGLTADNFSIETLPGQPELLFSAGYADKEDRPSLLLAGLTGVYGAQELRVRMTVGDRTTLILPAPVVRVARTPADVNADGIHDLTDIGIFVEAVTLGSDAADLSLDGVVDLNDIGIFVTEFTAP